MEIPPQPLDYTIDFEHAGIQMFLLHKGFFGYNIIKKSVHLPLFPHHALPALHK